MARTADAKLAIVALAVMQAVAAAQPAAAQAGDWRVEQIESEEDDSVTTTVWTLSLAPIVGGMGLGTYPELGFSCSAGVTTAYFLYRDTEFGSGVQDVTLRFDFEPPATTPFPIIPTGHGFGPAPDEDAIAFAMSLFGHDRLTVTVTPQFLDEIEVEFRVRDLEAAIAPVREACDW